MEAGQAVAGKGFSPDTIALLKARGHEIDEAAAAGPWRVVEAIVNDGGWLQGGVRRPRAPGRPRDY